MRIVKLTGLLQMELFEIPVPKINNPNEVLIKMETVGVCGSDIHYYKTGRIGSQVVSFPFAVGHEGAGIVAEVGTNVTHVKIGDRIAFDPAMSCGTCDQCLAGRSHTCRNLRFLGCPGQAEGCLADYIVLPENCCFTIPNNMDMNQAAIIEPLSIGVYAVEQSIPMKNAHVGILGYGPIGMSVHLAAKAKGAKQFYISDKLDYRVKAALDENAFWAGSPDKQDIVKEISTLERQLLDVVFECCGQQDAVDQAVRLLKPGGKLVMVGIPEVDRISFEMDLMRRKEIVVQNIRRQNECVEKAIHLVANGDINVNSMHTHTFSLSECKKAFDIVGNYQDNVMKAIIDFNL